MELDDVNKGILYVLQHDSRQITTREMADRIGVSASTIRNRIERLEEEGVIRGYYPEIDYDNAGLQLHVLFVCSASGVERSALAETARNVSGVVSVQEVLDGTENVRIEAVGTDTDDIARVGDELSAIGLSIANSKVFKSSHRQPFDHFGEQLVDEPE
ncbi:putative transcriptional regulator, AsnC family [Haloterrigena turkmenica DSM 5511]|uniref:Transcriptional regulator, AsnC family n=1 Tax=Haloterrigena turkmenica (strain ATCC 51198 / DSM 5511 / JCM 9101 / NCIMB 13204 / VKM B-1734 / 4k) TaxID=543526 RepID=D2RYC2_HALTV|nr:Lrp/AsnC family transcriptional regulator [Haloterrigena turkmenica]ADB61868.1 putative transcriptional regulator, AsnC family [Haloterrigena turkmenica DSM 5511]